MSVFSKVFLCRPQRNLLGCAYSWCLGILGQRDWGYLSMFCALFTASRGTYTGEGLFQRWRAGCDAVLLALDLWAGTSLNAFETSLQRKQIHVTTPSQGENVCAWEGEVMAQFGAFFPSPLAACPRKAKLGVLPCFANITTDTLAKGKGAEPLLSSAEIALFFLLNTNKALDKNEKGSQEQEFPEISCWFR